MRILIAITALCITGCGQHRPINPGADVEIHLVPLYAIHARFPQFDHPGAVTEWTATGKPQIWLPSDQGQAELVRTTIHEVLRHVVDRVGGTEATLEAIELKHWPLSACGRIHQDVRDNLEARARANAAKDE